VTTGADMDTWPGLSDAVPYGWTGAAALLGRLLFHAKQVQAGKRKPLTWTLLWDVPIALAMGWTAYGIGVWFDLVPQAIISTAIMASYLGPYTVDRIVTLGADRYLGRKKDAAE
jgi:CHASE2 domain-containing sensor protein